MAIGGVGSIYLEAASILVDARGKMVTVGQGPPYA